MLLDLVQGCVGIFDSVMKKCCLKDDWVINVTYKGQKLNQISLTFLNN